jgi:predicted TIM-barrel fold metal-dependent hydrolase
MQPLSRRQLLLAGLAASTASTQSRAPVVNGAEHAWVVSREFPMSRDLAVCPTSLPNHEYSAEFLLSEMKTYQVDHVVISHVCYYGRDNTYASHAVKKHPGRFAAIGLLVGTPAALAR